MNWREQRESSAALQTPQCVRTPYAVDIWLQSHSKTEEDMLWIKGKLFVQWYSVYSELYIVKWLKGYRSLGANCI